MKHATLLVVNGPSGGTRFDVHADDGAMAIGRSVGTRIRIDDTEVSRQHAKIHFDGNHFRLVDLGSANGTFVNGKRVTDAVLQHGDSIRLGATLLTFQLVGRPAAPATAEVVQLVDDSQSARHSAIVQQVQARSTSSLAVWPAQKIGLDLLHQVAEELVRPAHTLESLLQRILHLTLIAVRADRGCVLLRESIGVELTPFVFCRRQAEGDHFEGPHEQMCIPRSITGHVMQHGQAVRTSDAVHDSRFGGQSIVSSGIHEAICAPLRGQEQLLGVIYLDIATSALSEMGSTVPVSRLSEEHLKSVLAVARQTALAVESRQYHDALLKAERFAAMGQTIAVLSHHIKNILQGVRGGGYLIEMGLKQSQDDLVRQGWGIVERNQKRIYDLVMDMLSFSKDRVPVLETGDVNRICGEVAELAELTSKEHQVAFEFRQEPGLPPAEFDHEGIHRATLNIVMNALDAVAEMTDGRVVLQTGYDRQNDAMLIAVTDNGPGIPEEQRASVFQVFESSKGSGGTGIGLAVSRKIVREHGGRIRIEGEPGEGTRFVISWPRGNPKAETVRLDSATRVPE
ncbi:MAG: ATP-binding protein [Planctomycetaceae bacterium]